MYFSEHSLWCAFGILVYFTIQLQQRRSHFLYLYPRVILARRVHNFETRGRFLKQKKLFSVTCNARPRQARLQQLQKMFH
jgi:hypothetical protein